jgi:hypothetical protein
MNGVNAVEISGLTPWKKGVNAVEKPGLTPEEWRQPVLGNRAIWTKLNSLRYKELPSESEGP